MPSKSLQPGRSAAATRASPKRALRRSRAGRRIAPTRSRPAAIAVGIAVEGEHLRSGRREERLRVAAGAEGRVEIKAAGLRLDRRHDWIKEHGHVPGRSACGETIVIAAARYHSRAPRGRG